MASGRLIGGILALAGGALMALGLVLWIVDWKLPAGGPISMFNLVLIAVSIVGGILGILGKMSKIGGVLALVAGLVWIIGGVLLYTGSLGGLTMPTSLIYYFQIVPNLTWWFPIEAIFPLVGGILLLISSSD